MAADGPVILVRPETSPLDLHGIAAAAGVVTARGGPASHAAVVCRAMGKPAVVAVAALTVADGVVRAGGRTIRDGTLVAIDGGSGLVVLGDPGTTTTATGPYRHRLLRWADEMSGDTSERPDLDRLRAAHRQAHRAGVVVPPRRPGVTRGRPPASGAG
jgi:pyruvate,orthophosphate dikinase